MKFVYVDEQMAKNEQGAYTSATALVFDSNIIQEYREKLIVGLLDILHPRIPKKTTIEIHALPVLHAVTLLEGKSDDEKLAIFGLIFDLITEYKVSVFRLGYYDRSLAMLKDNHQRLDHTLYWLLHGVTDTLACEQVHIFEYNKQAHKHLVSYNDTYFQEMAAQIPNPEQNLSVRHSEKVLGRFYCDKKNHFMYSTDLGSGPINILPIRQSSESMPSKASGGHYVRSILAQRRTDSADQTVFSFVARGASGG